MITSIKWILLLGLLSVVVVGTSLRGAEPQTAVSPDEDNAEGRPATIVAVDKTKRTLTLRNKNANYLFFLNPHVIDTRTRQQIALDQLAAGQRISFVAHPRADGQLEIVSLIILHNQGGSAAAGGSRGGPVIVSPFR